MAKVLSFDQFCHFLIKKTSLQIYSYRYSNKASRWDKLSIAYENFIFWWSIGYPKWVFVINGQTTEAFFVHSNILNEFVRQFYIMDKTNFFWPPSKISIWVLNRTVMTSWVRLSIIKTHWTFRTRKRYILELYVPFINNAPYSSTKLSSMNAYYGKTHSAGQDSLPKYPYRYFQEKIVFESVKSQIFVSIKM